jgi:hypothetical protein
MLSPPRRQAVGPVKAEGRPPQAPHSQVATTFTESSLSRRSLTTSSRHGGTHGPVNPGAGQNQAGCFQGGQAGSGAPTRHEPTVKQVAVKPGVSPPAPPRRADPC